MEYIVYNQTDGIIASPDSFKSPVEAEVFITNFRKRFRFQGFYLTSDMIKIDPADVELEIVSTKEFWRR